MEGRRPEPILAAPGMDSGSPTKLAEPLHRTAPRKHGAPSDSAARWEKKTYLQRQNLKREILRRPRRAGDGSESRYCSDHGRCEYHPARNAGLSGLPNSRAPAERPLSTPPLSCKPQAILHTPHRSVAKPL